MESSLDSVLSGQAAPEVEQPAQVEQPAPEVQQPEPATGEQTGTPPEPQKDETLDKHRQGLEAGIAAERKRRQEAEERARAMEQQLQALRQPTAPQPAAQVGDPKPQRAQFETEDEWLDARDAWRDRERERQWNQQQQEREAFAKRQKTESALIEAAKLPGFDLQAFVRLPVSEHMADAILDSDVSPQLVHYLTANPEETQRIFGLPAARQIKELARIEDRLAAPPAQEPAPQKEPPRLPETLTQTRNAKGQFEPAYSGPTPLNSILK